VGDSVSLQSRRVLLKQFATQYREASSAQKRVLLDPDRLSFTEAVCQMCEVVAH
jgi:hypothetical protein